MQLFFIMQTFTLLNKKYTKAELQTVDYIAYLYLRLQRNDYHHQLS